MAKEKVLINKWKLITRGNHFALLGNVSNHPFLGNKEQVYTSSLLNIDFESRTAETTGNYYLLGEPFFE